MSTLRVELVSIDSVSPHPNADRLEIAQVRGWQSVVGKGQFKQGDTCVYIPIDSVLPSTLEAFLFPPDSKIKLEKSRVRSIKIRQALSQGMCVDLSKQLLSLYPDLTKKCVGDDVTDLLGITKYEPPVSVVPHILQGHQVKRQFHNPHFSKYTDIENFKNYPQLFAIGEDVYISEKLHGTSVRYGLLPSQTPTLWRKLKKLLGLLPKYEFCFGSRNVQLQYGRGKVFYDTNIYRVFAARFKIVLEPNEMLFGEIIGDGIQKGYTYGLGPKEWDFYAYDVSVDGRFLDYNEFKEWCDKRGVNHVPELYIGPLAEDTVASHASGDSLIGGQKVREGIVIKPTTEARCYIGRKVLKRLNDDYLLSKQGQSDFH